VITAIGRFTHCVAQADYHNLGSLGWTTGPGSLGKEGCDYITGGKMVCLGGSGPRCAVGTIVHIEPVGYDKSGFEQIDNDFCINLLLFPHEIEEFTGSTDKLTNWNRVKSDKVQGTLIDHDPATMPPPSEPAAEPTPYTVTYLFGEPGGPRPYEPNEDKTERLLEEVKQDAAGIKRVPIPVFHCEFEGSRAFAVCAAIAPFLDLVTGGPGSGACKAALGWIPFGIGDFVCTVVEWIVAAALAPLIAAAAAAAWLAAGITDDLAVTGPIARQVQLNDTVLLTGRWVWDGGHSGWNELHATHTLQRVVLPEKVTAGFPADEARTLVETWCGLASVAPPTGEAGQPLTVGLTPAQQETADNQNKPENTWEIHPSIDGCVPTPKPEEPAEPVEVIIK